ncbi:MAG: permease [Halanaerobiales bacterium]|nr:permease [Halanaerobiales bacterium]
MNKKDEQISLKKKLKKGLSNTLKYLVAITIILIILYQYFPKQIFSSLVISKKYGIEMVTIFPAVLILMGLADVWIPKSLINKYLGKESGLKGILISIFLGTLPTGPLYIAFPIASELLVKKARLSNVMIFLGVWASLKIPQISVEIKFLGIKFAILRFIFTLISIILIGYLIEYIVNKKEVVS